MARNDPPGIDPGGFAVRAMRIFGAAIKLLWVRIAVISYCARRKV
jgi:hypothetical protein